MLKTEITICIKIYDNIIFEISKIININNQTIITFKNIFIYQVSLNIYYTLIILREDNYTSHSF